MTTTYDFISSVTVGSGGAANIQFTSIPQTYTDLELVFSGRSARTSERDSVELYFNTNTSNYVGRMLIGNGVSGTNGNTSYGTSSINRMDVSDANSTTNTFGNMKIYIPNYTGSNYKSVSIDSVYEHNGTYAYQYLVSGIWSNTAAITSIKLALEIGPTFVQYSTAYLYGISNA